MRIQLAGGPVVIFDGRTIARFPTSRSRVLLAYLAYHRKHPHPREILAEMLWPGGEPDTIRLRLNQTAEMRKALGRPEGFLISDRQSLALDPDVSTDLGEFDTHLREARTQADRETKAATLTKALALADDEILPGMYEDWVIEARDIADNHGHPHSWKIAEGVRWRSDAK